MSSVRLLEQLERVADLPDGVARLRRFVRDLAVCGRLVAQDPNDIVSPELLQKLGTNASGHGDLPSNWRGGSLGTLLDFQYGDGLKATDRSTSGPVPVFGSNGIVGFTDKALTSNPAIIVGRKGSAGAVNLCEGPSWTTDVAYFVTAPPYFDIRYLFVSLDALQLGRLARGVKPGLSRSDAYAQTLLVPPLAEQRRIVSRLDELMSLCDELDVARTRRETARDRLTRASLGRVSAANQEVFEAGARFVLGAFGAITSRADQIDELRHAILDLAVRGKLVRQHPSHKPVSALLDRINAQRESLDLPQMGDAPTSDEQPYAIPRNWAWSWIGAICSKTGSGSTPRGGKAAYKQSGVPLLRSQNVHDDGLRLKGVAFIGSDTHERMRGTAVKAGDVLLNITGGSLGRSCRVPSDFGEANVSQHVAILRPAVDEIGDFLHLFVVAPFFQKAAFEKQTGAGRGGLPKNRMDRIPIPLPPVQEQREIIATVRTLMKLCDDLARRLDDTSQLRGNVLEALIARAVAEQPAALSRQGV